MLQPVNHWLFQVANSCLFLSFVSLDILLLRIVLAIGSLFFILWGALILDVSLDTVLWNSVFLALNTGFAVQIIYSRRPINFLRIEHEHLYQVI